MDTRKMKACKHQEAGRTGPRRRADTRRPEACRDHKACAHQENKGAWTQGGLECARGMQGQGERLFCN